MACDREIVALAAMVTFLIGCGGGGSGGAPTPMQAVSSSASQQTSANSAPLTLNFTATPENVAPGGVSTLSWDARPATSCTAAGGWAGDQPVEGVYTVGPIDTTTSFELNCEGAGDRVHERVTVRVADSMIRWRPPTRNVDGSPLTDLAGYVIHWGFESSNYTDSFRLESPSATEWTFALPPGNYYVAMTAFDSEGNVSTFSNEILKTIP